MVTLGGDALENAAAYQQELYAFMASLKNFESGGDYQIFGPETKYGRASGAYQFIDDTWGGYKGYKRAADAPKAVQDERAMQLINQYYNGVARQNWGAVAVAWHAGPGKVDDYFAGTLSTSDVNMSTMNYVNGVLAGMGQEGYDFSNRLLMDQASAEVQDAWQVAKQMLDDYGLSELFPEIESYLLKGLSPEAAIARVKDTDIYKKRFAGMQARLDNGYNAISPAQYLSQETAIKQLMAEAGFAPGFYDEPEDLAEFIANDVRPEEVRDRIKLAQRAVMDADPLIKAELQERFGIGLDTEADLVSYFLDPERAVPILEMKSQVGVAELGAATQRAMGTGRTLQTETAQELVRRGYSQREIGERLKGRGGMTQRMLGEGRGISATEVAAAEFGLDSEAVANVRRLRQERQQRGSRTSGAMITQAGVTGLGAVNT